MTSTLKLYGSIALLILLGLLVWGINSWDNNRLEAAYERGVAAERALWTAKAAEANDLANSTANNNTLISENTADQARANASKTTAASTAASQSIVEKISYVYRTSPPTACHPDGVPQPLPAGVLEGLDQARSAALGQAATTPGGLQPAQRNRPASAPNPR